MITTHGMTAMAVSFALAALPAHADDEYFSPTNETCPDFLGRHARIVQDDSSSR